MVDLEKRIEEAVRHFWRTRSAQAAKQAIVTGRKDQDGRSSVTAGKQIDGFINLVAELLVESGLPRPGIHLEKNTVVLPGWFRPTKEWDLIALVDGKLLASVEFKSQVGSFGNNFNNRSEEAIGSATDVLTAYREGAFAGGPRPWMGYFFLLEKAPGSTTPVAVKEPHYPVFPEFRGASYAERYAILCQKLVRERMYDAACLMLSEQTEGLHGAYSEPMEEIGFLNFATSLMAHVSAFVKMRGK